MSETATSNRHLLAVLAADLVGYSALMARDQDNALAVIRELRHRILEPRIIENGGQVIKRMGDGWLAGFPSVMDATASLRDRAIHHHSQETATRYSSYSTVFGLLVALWRGGSRRA